MMADFSSTSGSGSTASTNSGTDDDEQKQHDFHSSMKIGQTIEPQHPRPSSTPIMNILNEQQYSPLDESCIRKRNPIFTLKAKKLTSKSLLKSGSDNMIAGKGKKVRNRSKRSGSLSRLDLVDLETEQQLLIKEDSKEDNDDDFDNQLEYFTYDTAPRENRIILIWNVITEWSECLPTGAERLLCIMMAIFLVLMIITIQVITHVEGLVWTIDHIIQMLRWHHYRLCDPAPRGEVISFDCYVLLLISGWLLSILLAISTLVVHFVFWLLRNQIAVKNRTKM